VLIFCQKM